MVARGGSVREENRHPVDPNQSNHRHADFQNSKRLIRFIFFNKLPGRSLHDLQYYSGQFTTVPRKIHAVFESWRDCVLDFGALWPIQPCTKQLLP
jgi:hypothetical protein